jgi:hypothetical protein
VLDLTDNELNFFAKIAEKYLDEYKKEVDKIKR